MARSSYYPTAMECQVTSRADGSAAPGFQSRFLGILGLLGLFAWQGWMVLNLFGLDAPWQRLLSEEPIISGRHPLHLYHGYLGAAAFRERGSLCCYDPAFQAGYPKTPVFDSGSRLAELFLSVGGAVYRPAAYKVGLALCCLSLPLFLVVAARGIGLKGGTTCLAAALGVLVCWGTPGRNALEAGDLDLLTAALAALAQFGLLVSFDRAPGLGSWVGILVMGAVGWLANPLLFATLFPFVLLYYLSVGPRHQFLGWHAALLAGLFGGLAVNAFWLVDWVRHWWIRSPLEISASLLPHRTIQTVWNAPLWGDSVDRSLAVALVGAAALGVLVFNQCKQRPAARLLGLGAGGLLSLAVLGIASEPIGRLGTAQLLVPALWFATIPAAHALVQSLYWARRRLGNWWRVALLATGFGALVGLTARDSLTRLACRSARPTPLAVGLGPERAALVDTLKAVTGTSARILWEDRAGSPTTPHWTSLLPVLTGRIFLGGLDPNSGIDHAFASLVEQNLAGRPIAQWSDQQLETFCRRYNVGWVVCWSPAARARFAAWKSAQATARVSDQGPGWVFLIRRPHSFTLKGRAQLIHADCSHITLADVKPEDGIVLLSFHYLAGLRASPSRVQVDREPDADDPISLIRLRVSGPVARVKLSWENR
jgi:hypothetical protein